MKSIFKIQGIDCANCAAQLENAIRKVEGIQSASISFMAERMVIEYDEQTGLAKDIMLKIVTESE